MKLGYSLVLGEYVNAEKIDNEDFKYFKVVCPICKGPIFKAESETQSIQYLSHYNRNQAAAENCELKITTITKEEVQLTNNLFRSNNIEYLLSVLDDAILENEYPKYPGGIESLKATLNKLHHSSGVQILRYRVYVLSKRKLLPDKDGEITELFDEYIREIQTKSDSFSKTQFSLEIQKRFASDIWKHLFLEETKDNLSFIMIHAYNMLLMRIEANKNFRELYDFELKLHLYMRKLIDATQDQPEEIFHKMTQFVVRPPHTIEKTNLLNKMVLEITHEMLRCLIKLPYVEIIKKKNAFLLN